MISHSSSEHNPQSQARAASPVSHSLASCLFPLFSSPPGALALLGAALMMRTLPSSLHTPLRPQLQPCSMLVSSTSITLAAPHLGSHRGCKSAYLFPVFSWLRFGSGLLQLLYISRGREPSLSKYFQSILSSDLFLFSTRN